MTALAGTLASLPHWKAGRGARVGFKVMGYYGSDLVGSFKRQ